MTVAELIEKLKKHNPESIVYILKDDEEDFGRISQDRAEITELFEVNNELTIS